MEVTTEKLPKEVYGEVTATSEENTAEHKQGIENAFDDNLDTFWHAQWGDPGKLENHEGGISVEIPLKEEKEIAKLSYLPKAGDTGTIGEYVIEAAVVKEDGKKLEKRFLGKKFAKVHLNGREILQILRKRYFRRV